MAKVAKDDKDKDKEPKKIKIGGKELEFDEETAAKVEAALAATTPDTGHNELLVRVLILEAMPGFNLGQRAKLRQSVAAQMIAEGKAVSI